VILLVHKAADLIFEAFRGERAVVGLEELPDVVVAAQLLALNNLDFELLDCGFDLLLSVGDLSE
jgi:hypothetical protein